MKITPAKCFRPGSPPPRNKEWRGGEVGFGVATTSTRGQDSAILNPRVWYSLESLFESMNRRRLYKSTPKEAQMMLDVQGLDALMPVNMKFRFREERVA